MLTDMHYASVHAAHGLYMRCLYTYMGVVYHIYTPTDIVVGLHVCPEIGMFRYVVYKPILTGLTSTNMLVYMLTDTCSNLKHVCGDQTFFTACFTNLHLEGLNQCPRIRHAQAHIYTKCIHKEIELFIVMVYTRTLVDIHTCANIVLLCKRIGTYTCRAPERPGSANSGLPWAYRHRSKYSRVEVGVRDCQGATEDGGLTMWHHGDLLHVVAQQVVQRAAYGQRLIHMAQAQCAHHLELLLLRPVRHIRLQLALLLGTVPQRRGRQLPRTPAENRPGRLPVPSHPTRAEKLRP